MPSRAWEFESPHLHQLILELVPQKKGRALKHEKIGLHADVVELVDTLASGASAFTGVGVRVSPSAPIMSFILSFILTYSIS